MNDQQSGQTAQNRQLSLDEISIALQQLFSMVGELRNAAAPIAQLPKEHDIALRHMWNWARHFGMPAVPTEPEKPIEPPPPPPPKTFDPFAHLPDPFSPSPR